MVTEPNLFVIKTRIVDIINREMFDKTGKGLGFVTIKKGLPNNNHFLDIPKPACFVTNAPNLEVDRPFGPVQLEGIIQTAGASQHDFTFAIQIFDQGDDTEEIDKNLDRLHKKLKEVLKENFKLTKPGTDQDPLVTESLFTTTTNYSAEQDGKFVDGRIFLFTCIAISV